MSAVAMEVKQEVKFRDMAGDGVHAKVYDMTKDLVRPRNVLVAGCGEGAFERRLIDGGIDPKRIKSADILPKYHKVPQVECTYANLNDKLPFADRSFSMMYALEVIEHLHNPKRLIQEAYRVLDHAMENEGYLVISTPNPQSLIQRLRFLVGGELMWFSNDDYLGSGHIHPIYDWLFERFCRGMFERVKYDSQQYKFGPLPAPKSMLFAVNNIYVLRKLAPQS